MTQEKYMNNKGDHSNETLDTHTEQNSRHGQNCCIHKKDSKRSSLECT